MKQLFNLSRLTLLAVLSVVSTTRSVLASGIALTEHSVPNLSNAAAGGAAAAEDATTIFFNPAGLTRLSENSVVGAGYVIFSETQFQNQGSTVATGSPLSGGEGGNGGVDLVVPNLYLAWSLSDRAKVGLGVNVPFGLATEYDSDWVGRYQAIESELKTININPAAAVKLTDNVSVGAGVNLQYAKADLSNAIDFGLIGLQAGLGTRPQQLDGGVEISGDDWSWGYNLGVLYEPTENTRIGLAYRSAITHNLEGDADFNVPTAASPLTARGQFLDTDAKADLKLPDTLSLSAYHQISPRWAVMGDITWANWSRFEELRISFDNPAQPDTVQPENWRDTVRLAVGVKYIASDAWTLRAGVAYDPSPVRDEFVTARIPDGDRTWITAGLSYQPSPSLQLHLMYAHLFFDDRTINLSDPVAGTLRGEFNSNVDIIGAQLNWSF